MELLKAIAIAAMIFNHSWGFILHPADLKEHAGTLALRWGNIFHFFCFFNLWIPALAGSMLRLQMVSEQSETRSCKALSNLAFQWGLILGLGGYGFSIWTDSSSLVSSFNPLHFMALSFFLMGVFLKLFSLNWLKYFSGLFIIVSFFLEPFRNQQSTAHQVGFLNEIIFGNERVGWSLVPWFALVLIGFTFADSFLRVPNKKRLLIWSTGLGLVIALVGLTYPDSLVFIGKQTLLDQYSTLLMPRSLWISVLSGYICLLSLTTLIFQKNDFPGATLISPLSRGSFWIFFLQFPIMVFSSICFEDFSFTNRMIFFPCFNFLWCFVLGCLAVELGKKRVTISFVKRRDAL